MAFVDQGEFEAMKTLSGRRAPRCNKHQFRAKITASASSSTVVGVNNVPP